MELIHPGLIQLDIHVTSKDDVLQIIANLVAQDGRVSNRQDYLNSLYERERIAPTDIGLSVAIPHGKTDAVLFPTLVFLRLTEELSWNEEPVKLIFGIAVPATSSENLHLKMLQKVARKIMNEDVRQIFLSSTSKEEILQTILA